MSLSRVSKSSRSSGSPGGAELSVSSAAITGPVETTGAGPELSQKKKRKQRGSAASSKIRRRHRRKPQDTAEPTYDAKTGPGDESMENTMVCSGLEYASHTASRMPASNGVMRPKSSDHNSHTEASATGTSKVPPVVAKRPSEETLAPETLRRQESCANSLLRMSKSHRSLSKVNPDDMPPPYTPPAPFLLPRGDSEDLSASAPAYLDFLGGSPGQPPLPGSHVRRGQVKMAHRSTMAASGGKKTAKPSQPTGILKPPTVAREPSADGQQAVLNMGVVPLPSWAGTPDATADRKWIPEPQPAVPATAGSHSTDTSLLTHQGKKAHFGVLSLKEAANERLRTDAWIGCPAGSASYMHESPGDVIICRDGKDSCSICQSRNPAIILTLVTPLTATSSRRGIIILKMAAVMAMLTFAVGATLILVFWLRGDRPPDDMYCNSADCLHHEALIGAMLNRSIDPCEDFGAFVCSAWMASSAYGNGSPSTQQDVVDAWSMRFESILKAAQSELKAPGSKALGMFELCKEMPPRTYASAIAALRKFMDERNISWPQKPMPSARPLALLLDLELNWGVTLWFHIRHLRKQGKRVRALIISPSKLISNWLELHGRLVASGGFFNYWRMHYELLAPLGVTKATEKESKRVANMQTSVLQKLLDASRMTFPAQFLLKDIEKNITSISSQEWIALLNEHLNPDPAFADDDRIIVTHSTLLHALDTITRTYKNSELVDSLSWLFVQALAPVADLGLLAPVRADSANGPDDMAAAAAAQRTAFCAARVESAYRFLIISVFTLLNFSSEERENIDARLRVIRGAAADKVAGARQLDLVSKQRAQEKLNQTTTLLWPIAELVDKTAMSILYTSFPDNDSSFAALWLRTLKSLRGLSRNYVYDEALHLPANLALPLLDYDYVLNDVHISMQALSPPIFYLQGTHAMFYGGLGFLYASQLVRALDSRGLRIGSDTQVTGLWLSSAWRHAVMDVDSCLGAGESHFPEIPALEVSYGALEQALGQSDDLHQRLRDGFTERQLFFVTLCYLMCSRPGTDPSGDCNKAVMNFPPFAHEFGCPRNSKMKPAKYCPFFDSSA